MFRQPTIRARRYTFRDAPIPMSGSEVSPMPDGNPTSTTLGGTAGPGMMSELVAAFPVGNNEYAYWPVTKPDKLVILRRDFGNNPDGEVVGQYPRTDDSHYWFDVSPTFWRLWRTQRQRIDLGEVRPGIVKGRAVSKIASDRAMKLRAMNEANQAHWARR